MLIPAIVIAVDTLFKILIPTFQNLGSIGALHFGEYAWNKVEPLPEGVVTCFDWGAVEREVERIAA